MSKAGKLRQAQALYDARKCAKESGALGEFRSLQAPREQEDRTHVLIKIGESKRRDQYGRAFPVWQEVNPVEMHFIGLETSADSRANEAFGHLFVNVISGGWLTYRKGGRVVRYEGPIKVSTLKNPGGRK